MTFDVGDVWDDGVGLRIVLAVYELDVLVAWLPHDVPVRDILVLPGRLFAEGRCGTKQELSACGT